MVDELKEEMLMGKTNPEVIMVENSSPVTQLVDTFQRERVAIQDKKIQHHLEDGIEKINSMVRLWQRAVDNIGKTGKVEGDVQKVVGVMMRERLHWPHIEPCEYLEFPIESVTASEVGRVGSYYSPTFEEVNQAIADQADRATTTERILHQLGFLPAEESLADLFTRLPLDKGQKNIYDLMWESEPKRWSAWAVHGLKSELIPGVAIGVNFMMSNQPGMVDTRLGFSFQPKAIAESLVSSKPDVKVAV